MTGRYPESESQAFADDFDALSERAKALLWTNPIVDAEALAPGVERYESFLH